MNTERSLRIGVLLSGSGVYDGTEIQEGVFTLLEIERHGGNVICFAPNAPQYHVINHLTGEVMDETRNCLVEAARIARGNVHDVATAKAEELDALVLPGGFGAAKNFTTWAIDGPDTEIREDVKAIIRTMVYAEKPVVALCMAPTAVAKALEGTWHQAHLTVGTTDEASPYDIAGISAGMEKVGARAHMNTVREITVDASNHIITAPCYMMEATITEVAENVRQAIDALFAMLEVEADHV